MTMQLTPKIVLEILSHEAMVRQTYKDSVGVSTWSVGITNASGHNVERYWRNPQSMERCLAVYIWVLQRYLNDVEAAFSGTDLTEAQTAAALSFHYNTGAIARASWVKLFKAGKTAQARASIMKWRKPASIIKRRERERDLFFSGQWTHSGWQINEYTRVTASGQPDRRSIKRVDIKDALLAAMAGHTTDPQIPDIPPEPVTPKQPSGGMALILAALAAIAGALFKWVF